jgi:hypothetical protein
MQRRQRNIIARFVAVMVVTAVAVVGMINLKDWVNRSEAIRAMEQLGQVIVQYRSANGSVPAESRIDDIRQTLEGQVRLGELRYRGLWIDHESTKDEILAYVLKHYRSSFVEDGYVVLRLDGRVEWMERKQFEELLAQQQTQREMEMLEKYPRDEAEWGSPLKVK